MPPLPRYEAKAQPDCDDDWIYQTDKRNHRKPGILTHRKLLTQRIVRSDSKQGMSVFHPLRTFTQCSTVTAMALREGIPFAAAAVAAPLAGTLWWMLVDNISLAQAFGSPFPYLTFAISWFLATPIYVVAHSWIDGKIWRVLLLATAGATPFVIKAATYFLTPRSIFVAF